MFGFKKSSKKKLVHFYAVFRASDYNAEDISASPALSITVSQEEAMQIISHQLFLKHYEHYKAWCDGEGVSYGFGSDSWDRYCSIFFSDPEEMDPEDRFYIIGIEYNMEGLASILRMFSNCDPQFLPFESPLEWSYFIPSRDSKDDFKKTMVYLNKLVACRPEIKPDVSTAINDAMDYYENNKDPEIKVDLEK